MATKLKKKIYLAFMAPGQPLHCQWDRKKQTMLTVDILLEAGKEIAVFW